MDLAILSMSDHVIIGIGTFSWWAGWLCKGTTIYFDEPVPNGSSIASRLKTNLVPPPDDQFNKWLVSVNKGDGFG